MYGTKGIHALHPRMGPVRRRRLYAAPAYTEAESEAESEPTWRCGRVANILPRPLAGSPADGCDLRTAPPPAGRSQKGSLPCRSRSNRPGR